MDSNQKGFLPQQFEANNLFLVYAQNQLQATGNAQNLKIKLNAPALYDLYPGLSGRAYGDLSVQSQPRLKATANIAVDNFAFNTLVSIKNFVSRVNCLLRNNTNSVNSKIRQFT